MAETAREWHISAVRNVSLIVFVISLLTSIASGALPEQKEINQLYQRGLRGDKQAVIQCIEKLELVLRTQNDNQLARVYLGSAYTLRSRDLGFGPAKLQTLKKGLALMDAAVAQASDDPRVRLARALTLHSFPFFLGKRKAALADFQQLATTAENQRGSLNTSELQLLYYSAGVATKQSGNKARALELWKKGLEYPADAELTAKLQAAIGQTE